MRRALLLIALCASFARADSSLSFTVTTSSVSISTHTALDNLVTGTICVWGNSLDATNTRIIDKNGTQRLLFVGHDTIAGDLRFGYNRSVSSLNVRATGMLTSGTTMFMCATWNANGANSDQHLYVGTQKTVIAEAGSYATQSVGSGTHDDSNANLAIGNSLSAANSWNGWISWVGIWNRPLSLNELKNQQYCPYVSTGNVGFWNLGFNGAGNQYDLSGNGGTGIVGAATASSAGAPTCIGGAPL